MIMDRKLLYTYGVRVPHPDGYYGSKVVIGVARNSCSRTVVAVVHLCALVNGGQHLLFCCCTNARWCMCMCVCFVLVFVFVFVLFCFVLFFFVFFFPFFAVGRVLSYGDVEKGALIFGVVKSRNSHSLLL